MYAAQINVCQRPTVYLGGLSASHRRVLKPSNLSFHGAQVPWKSLKLSSSALPRLGMPLLKPRRFVSVCLSNTVAGGDNEGSPPWKAFEQVVGNFTKGSSVEDVLQKQIEKEFYPDREGGGKRPPGGRGGGGGGGPDGSGGSKDEGFSGILDETLQVVLATVGFIFLYIYIISGEELIKLAKDYIKYVFKGTESVRLKRVLNQWRRFFRRVTEKKVFDKHWLEREIINTPTWWDNPQKYRHLLRDDSETKQLRPYGESTS